MIHYASHTLNDVQLNNATTEKELLTIVFAFINLGPTLLATR